MRVSSHQGEGQAHQEEFFDSPNFAEIKQVSQLQHLLENYHYMLVQTRDFIV